MMAVIALFLQKKRLQALTKYKNDFDRYSATYNVAYLLDHNQAAP
jgi:hypothetical protein